MLNGKKKKEGVPIRLRRGLKKRAGNLAPWEPAFITDTEEIAVGTPSGPVFFRQEGPPGKDGKDAVSIPGKAGKDGVTTVMHQWEPAPKPKDGEPGPPGRSVRVFEQAKEPKDAQPGDHWINPKGTWVKTSSGWQSLQGPEGEPGRAPTGQLRKSVPIDGRVNNYVLTADSTVIPWGTKWAAAGGAGAVFSVFGRVGAVVAAANDYTEAQLSFSDITTNDVSITKHGFVPKAPNDATKYLDGTGAYSVPPGGSIAVGTTAITGGTATRLVYESSTNKFGEVSGATSDGTSVTYGSNNLIATSPKIVTGISDTNAASLIAFTATGSAIFGLTLANAASGGTVALGVTTPTQAASGIAGTPVSLTASAAVAGSANAGAVAGGAVTIQGGIAARLTSGNAQGGDVVLAGGTGIGTGATGQICCGLPGTVDGTKEIIFNPNSAADACWRFSTNAGEIILQTATTRTAAFTSRVRFLLNSVQVVSATGAVVFGTADGDTGMKRAAAAVVTMTNAVSGSGWLQQSAGDSRVSSNVTNVTTTLAAITGLSATLIAGRKYAGRLVVYVNEGLAADGLKIDFNGGAATMTSFRAHGTIWDTALLLSTQVTAINTAFTVATITGDSMVEIYFGLVCNAAGTFIPQFAKNTDAAGGTLTAYLNSHLSIRDIP